ncbi:MAG: hypothetical protein Q9213_006059 [Squamulea squamosa]
MANEEFEHEYPGGVFQYPNHPSLQRFLQLEGPYSADRPIFDQKQPQFSGKNEYYGSPNPWLHNINTAHDPYPQECWSNEWPSLDQESCSGATGNTWSPQATESCSDHDHRFSSWTAPQPLTGGYSYPGYGHSLANGAGAGSPHSNTGTLSEIQQYPDTEAEDSSVKGEMHGSDLVYPAIAARRGSVTASFSRDEGLGSSINESAIASSNTEDEVVGIDSANGDSDNGSDYSPQGRPKRIPRHRKPRANPGAPGSISPVARRLSSAKSKPHQLTRPARITKRPSSAPKASIPTQSPSASQVLAPAHNIRCNYPHCSHTFPSSSTLSKHVLSAHTRPFTCSFARYGCNSTFGSKNEWKRHVSSIHLCLGLYRCDVGASCIPNVESRVRNDSTSSLQPSHSHQQGGCGYRSNRKDLFTQHLHRMHRPAASASRAERDYFDNSLDEVRRRCWISLREAPPRSICGYCAPHPSRQTFADGSSPHHNIIDHHKTKYIKPAIFTGSGSWDERMEHVGRHLEKGAPETEVEDLELRDWMVGQGLLELVKGSYRVVGVGSKRRGRGAAGVIQEERAAEEAQEVGEEDADGDDE